MSTRPLPTTGSGSPSSRERDADWTLPVQPFGERWREQLADVHHEQDGQREVGGSPRRISTTAPGPPVEAPMAMTSSGPLADGGGSERKPSEERWPMAPSRARGCVMTLIARDQLDGGDEPLFPGSSASSPRGLSSTSTAPAASAS